MAEAKVRMVITILNFPEMLRAHKLDVPLGHRRVEAGAGVP